MNYLSDHDFNKVILTEPKSLWMVMVAHLCLEKGVQLPKEKLKFFKKANPAKKYPVVLAMFAPHLPSIYLEDEMTRIAIDHQRNPEYFNALYSMITRDNAFCKVHAKHLFEIFMRTSPSFYLPNLVKFRVGSAEWCERLARRVGDGSAGTDVYKILKQREMFGDLSVYIK